ncbi:MAG: glutathione S-transferase N-terminal domain-containing protein [Xanthomonadales bacterium]|nr:hypothetical protein [Xanthomonadales bacterium]MCC6594059.1 glutathione S-transferase N-terminal domain-containing protein [Xanthomonadales bacterium]MCE7930889.1 hypothetical protein [Xanthomonadales bacterium PRO6]
MRTIKQIAWLMMFVLVGGLAGIGGKQVYREWNQPRSVEVRDYRGLLAEYDTDVVLFSTTTCPFCQKARESLRTLGVQYRELAIDQSETADAAFKALGERGVPVLIVPDRLIRGFQPEAYRELFGGSGQTGVASTHGLARSAP